MIPSFTNHLFISFVSPSLGLSPAFFKIDLQVLLLHFKGLSSLLSFPSLLFLCTFFFIYSFLAASGWVLAVAWGLFPCSSQASL